MTEHVPVVVVGAGPVGLAAALALRGLDVPVTVLEADPADRVRPGSRALYLHADSLARLDRRHPGLAEEICAHGVVWHTRRTLYRGREVFHRRYAPAVPGTRPPFTSLRQVDTERFLLRAVQRAGAVLRWATAVEDAESTVDGVRLVCPDGRELHADWVIAADGARSAVRRALGIPLEGHRSPRFHVVIDVANLTDRPQPLERVFHYHHPRAGGRHVLLVPFAGGFQVDIQCLAEDRPEDVASEDACRQWLARLVGGEYADQIMWISTYHFQQRVAASFVDPCRRVLLAGEAAHLFAPFGARGMNSGIADADRAAEAVAALYHGSAGHGSGGSAEAGATSGSAATLATHPTRVAPGHAAELIDRYNQVRRQAALDNRDAAAGALAHLQARWSGRLAQRAATLLAPVVPALGQWLERAPYGPRPAPGRSGRY
jgi:3-(3-hydroxy-phenyl)propionate hydroxylase